ncbi:GNAT family N-acetyltransferase [Leifsonia sp. ZF2019]|uniref:GNAT family N-acetyltransferase n=1 Tax=Leifsonia sp. ZF2019 TaxID=2781978 RepID=UPI001CBEB986|nr:GNAT family N-acetyltransferase [Leifsonia sp. ZF2019]UAJ79303.1 GNAT family N-acetyltransferase [Leifsonia sp. ZF2019]
MTHIDVRSARPDEWAAVGGLRWDSLLEFGGVPDDDRAVFAARFAEWAASNGATHECIVAVDADGVVVGMAWLARTLRVPSARSFHRASADLQCAYVVPGLRNDGVGGRLIDAVVAHARSLGVERVTVHSSPRAVGVYERHGFASEERLLHRPIEHDDIFTARD